MQKVKKYEDHLMQAIGFTETDLEANQAGRFSARQQMDYRRQISFWLDLAVLAVVSGILFSALAIGSGINNSSGLSDISGQVAVVCVIACGVFLYALMCRQRDTFLLNDNRVERVEGRIQLDINDKGYCLKVEGIPFRLDKGTFLAFKNGDPYRIYYASHRFKILSVEWLRDQDGLNETA